MTDELNKEIVELHELSKHLYLFVTGIRKEMETCDVPFLSNTKLDELRPYTKEAVQGLEQLQAVLDLPAPAHLTPFSKSTSVVRFHHRLSESYASGCLSLTAYTSTFTALACPEV